MSNASGLRKFVPNLNPSQAAVSRVFKIPHSTISYRVRHNGVTPLKAAQMPNKMHNSLAELARERGWKPDTLQARVYRMQKRWPNLPREEIIARALRRPLKPWGTGIRKTAKKHGMSATTLQRRLTAGMTLAEAIAMPIDLRFVKRWDPRKLAAQIAAKRTEREMLVDAVAALG